MIMAKKDDKHIGSGELALDHQFCTIPEGKTTRKKGQHKGAETQTEGDAAIDTLLTSTDKLLVVGKRRETFLEPREGIDGRHNERTLVRLPNQHRHTRLASGL